MAEARKAVGLHNSTVVSNEDILREIDSAKTMLSEELREKLNNGETINFDGDAVRDSLRYYVLLRLDSQKSGGPDNAGTPPSVSKLKQQNMDNSQASYWRDQLLRSIREM